ncbi:MAG: glycosyltransferase family 4 protein, partial [Acidimicrobiales bacterium]|nr:glycosyltransferase family 4 protein [Acidimicrobiales bacterium]
ARAALARRALAHLRDVPVVYCNSVISLRMVHLLGEKPPVVVSHVHELMGALEMPNSDSDRERLRTLPDEIVVASDLVGDYLVDRHGIDRARLSRHYEFIEVDAFLDAVPPTSGDLRAELGIPADAAVVGAMGVTEARKGPDLFLSLASAFRRRDLGRPVHFVWVGARPDTEETRWIEHDVDKAGLDDVVHVLPPQAVPAPWFQLFDVFALTSREDPFPLVCLESSLLGTPIVCFDNTGMAEFAGAGECGFVVPYRDVEAMADQVEALLRDDGLRSAVGERAAQRVRDRHDVLVAAPALWADLQRWAGQARG